MDSNQINFSNDADFKKGDEERIERKIEKKVEKEIEKKIEVKIPNIQMKWMECFKT